MFNIPEIKLGIVAVSCVGVAKERLAAVTAAFEKNYGQIIAAKTVVSDKQSANTAMSELKNEGVNAVVIYIAGNGADAAEDVARSFDGPVMLAAAKEATTEELTVTCGGTTGELLRIAAALKKADVRVYIAPQPVAETDELGEAISRFLPVARIILGAHGVNILNFGKGDVAPLCAKVTSMSELELFAEFTAHNNDERIVRVVEDMEKELTATGNLYPGILARLAQFEITLFDIYENRRNGMPYAAFVIPYTELFYEQFGFCPDYVAARLSKMGIPVVTDGTAEGTLSAYMLMCAANIPAATLTISAGVPSDMFRKNRGAFKGFDALDAFIGTNNGSVASEYLESGCALSESGALTGRIKAGDITAFCIDADGEAYVAPGKILELDTHLDGTSCAVAIKGFPHFLKNVLLEKGFSERLCICFDNVSRAMYDAMKLLFAAPLYNKPETQGCNLENPFI